MWANQEKKNIIINNGCEIKYVYSTESCLKVESEAAYTHRSRDHQIHNKGSSIRGLCSNFYRTHWTSRAGVLSACENRRRQRLCDACQEVLEQRSRTRRLCSQFFMILDPQAKLFHSKVNTWTWKRRYRNVTPPPPRHSPPSTAMSLHSEQSSKAEENCIKTCVGGLRLIYFPLLSLKCFIQSMIILFPVTVCSYSNMKSISEAR